MSWIPLEGTRKKNKIFIHLTLLFILLFYIYFCCFVYNTYSFFVDIFRTRNLIWLLKLKVHHPITKLYNWWHSHSIKLCQVAVSVETFFPLLITNCGKLHFTWRKIQYRTYRIRKQKEIGSNRFWAFRSSLTTSFSKLRQMRESEVSLSEKIHCCINWA